MSYIPFVDLPAQMAELEPELSQRVAAVLREAAFIGGTAVERFERHYADFVGSRHCVGVANGTDALELALRAVGAGPGWRVVLPANTFIATAEAAVRAGAEPVLVDVDPDALLMDPKALLGLGLGERDVVVPVHLFGQMAPMADILAIAAEAGAMVVEDAAQAQGAVRDGRPAGTVGVAAATSFYPGKNLGAAGDAGAVTTDDAALARTVRLTAAHGSEHKYAHEILGFNSRLDAVQAVVLDAKLGRLAEWNERRRRAAARYDELLSGLDGLERPVVHPGSEPVWHLYVVRVPRRDEILEHLGRAGIGAGIHYPVPVHRTPAFAGLGLGLGEGSFPVAERAAGEILSLPMHPHLGDEQQVRVVEELARALSG